MNRNSEYFERLGRRLWFRGDYYKALEVLRAGLALYPDEPGLCLGIAMAQLRLGSYAVAHELLSGLLAQQPDNGDALVAACEAALHLGRKQEALELARRLGARKGVTATLLEHVGTLFLQHGIFEQAAHFLRKSLALEPGRPYAMLGLGIACKGLGRETEAVRVLEAALKISSRFYEAMSYLGNIIYDRGRQKEAVALFLKIPPARQMDPVTLSRLIEYCRSDKALARKVPAYEARLKELATTYDIGNFIRMLERKAARPGPAREKPAGYVFLKASPSRVSAETGAALARLDAALRPLFGKKRSLSGRAKPPVPSALPPRAVALFFEELALYLKAGVQDAGRDALRWLRYGGFVSLAPYAVALVRAVYAKQSEFGLRQETADTILQSLLGVARAVPPSARGAGWLVELGGTLIGFWTRADMLERALLISEIMPPSGRKNAAPVIARGRAWRRWLGFKAYGAWAHPSLKILPAKAATANRTAHCARCGREIRDYGYIAHAEDAPAVFCGDCAPALRCPDCGGPMRQVSAQGEGRPAVYACMQCLKRHQLRGKKK